jgi:hypothetical protein
MGKLILCTGISDNLGDTTFAAALAQYIADSIKKRCLFIAPPDFYETLSGEKNATYSLSTVMNYATSEKNLNTIIDGNIETFNNSKLEILFSKTLDYSSEQYITLLNSVTKMFDFTIINHPLTNMPKELIDYSNTVFLTINQDLKNIRNVKSKCWKMIENEKTITVINKYESGILSREKIRKLLSIPKHKTIFKIRYDKSIIAGLNSKNIAFNETKYKEDIILIGDYILALYGLVKKKKWYEKLLSSKKEAIK